MSLWPSARTRHKKQHPSHLPFDDCWSCQRDLAVCKSKLAFDTREAVDDWMRQVNEFREYKGPNLIRYPCVWCMKYHTKTAKQSRDLARVERARRKWLIAKRLASA